MSALALSKEYSYDTERTPSVWHHLNEGDDCEHFTRTQDDNRYSNLKLQSLVSHYEAESTSATNSIFGLGHSGSFLSSAMDTLLRRLKSFETLASGWDGYPNSRPPSQETFEETKKLLSKLSGTLLRTAKAEIAGDGDVSFVWKTKSFYAEILCAGDGLMGFFLRDDGADFYEEYGDIDLTEIEKKVLPKIQNRI